MPAKKELSATVKDNSVVDIKSGCWNWVGCKCKDGYGKARNMSMPGETLAHRMSFRAFKGEIPEGMEIDHECKNRGCVNPEHLIARTHADNVRRSDLLTNHRNAVKTHCLRGHAFEGANLYLDPTTHQRRCRACAAMRAERRKAAQA